eukprot:CAMPEP_0194156882 /NCGR_PEP_ID=MMETSP0152-20130528/69905_1 /TAXON_ID=1049557 /ORGANISM="Thalassiothrix antarctica, Strain L6-D1" /LENGTH=126 /DNA_ID=CAMNT_0038864885 /DNA_START=243 /DNA_END=620 /DNA_ORIENTATION=+
MVFTQTNAARDIERSRVAPYVRLCVPSISLLWYPFTVASKQDDVGKLRIIFRKYGYFTSNLWKRLQEEEEEGRNGGINTTTGVVKPPPTILVDAYYCGPDWLTSAFQHDVVMMITGGIGVTPFLCF